jgi:hypothetical protein
LSFPAWHGWPVWMPSSMPSGVNLPSTVKGAMG